jgi:pimeloyl-ACP methyl ester carboxylesterase
MHVEITGRGPRVVLVHGSVTPGWMTWNAQKPLASRFTLVVSTRSGYPPNPPLESIDFNDQARELGEVLEPDDHLVAHSYGAVVSLLAAARAPIASLTVVEPPALGVARGHPAVEAFIANFEDAPSDPRAYLELFLPLVGSALQIPEVLPPALEAGARAAVAERSPDEAEIPLDELAATDSARSARSSVGRATQSRGCQPSTTSSWISSAGSGARVEQVTSCYLLVRRSGAPARLPRGAGRGGSAA